MKTRSATIAISCGFLVTLSLGGPSRLMGQAAPGPLPVPPQSPSATPRPAAKPKPKPPEVPARKTLDGPWKFNHDESDDPKTKIQDSRGTRAGTSGSGGGYPGGSGGGGYPGGGYPPGTGPYPGGGGYPGSPFPGGNGPGGNGPYGGRGGRDTESDEKLEQLIRPSATVTFALKAPEVDLTDDQARKQAFFTDGRKLQKSKDDSYQEIAAHWEGNQLVSDEKSPQGSKLSRSFELAPDGKQFFETIHVDRGKSKGLLTVRYVYDVANGQETELTHADDPNQPVMKRRPDDSSASAGSQGSPASTSNDPDQPVMKRRTDEGGSDSSSSPSSTSSTPAAPSNPEPDPDQPVMRRRTDNNGPSQ